MTTLILGAHSDIALAIAKEFAAQGHDLILAARKPERLEPTATALREQYGKHISTLDFDATDYDGHIAFVEGLNPFPDHVVCCFGYLGNNEKSLTDPEEANRILEVNFNGAISILNPLAERFEGRASGSIIGISSVAGDRGRASNILYGAAKAGFTTYLSALRNRVYPKGVHVMTVKPGFVRTKMLGDLETPAAITASSEEVAKAVWKGFRKQRSVIYTKASWRPIMWIIKHLPEFIFKRKQIG